jgi:hypothetical protein
MLRVGECLSSFKPHRPSCPPTVSLVVLDSLNFPKTLQIPPSLQHTVSVRRRTSPPNPAITTTSSYIDHVGTPTLPQESASNNFREVLLGITGKDFTIVAASKAAMRGASVLKANDDKTRNLNPHSLMAFSGEAGDTGMEQR